MAVYTGARTYQQVNHSDPADVMIYHFEWWLYQEINAYAWDLSDNPYRTNAAKREATLFKLSAKSYLKTVR